MTDDKGAGEMNNPYEHEDCDSDFGGCGDKCKRSAYEDGYAAGRKAERERFFKALDGLLEDNGGLTTHECLQIMRDELGGQDAK